MAGSPSGNTIPLPTRVDALHHLAGLSTRYPRLLPFLWAKGYMDQSRGWWYRTDWWWLASGSIHSEHRERLVWAV
jgi:hypothetical protein